MLVVVYKGSDRRVELRPQRPVIGSAFFRQQKNIPVGSMNRLQTALLRFPVSAKEVSQ